MRRYIMVIAVVSMFAACTQEQLDVPQESGKTRFTAILEGAQATTKTYLGEEVDGAMPIYWSEGDKIKVFVSQHEISDGQGYQLDLESGAGTVESVFTGSVPTLPDGSLYYYAVYPYSLGASIGGMDLHSGSGEAPAEDVYGDWEEANSIQIPLPSVQIYSPHSFGRDYNPALAISRDQTFRFKNLCGVLRINLTGNVTVGKIVIEGDGDEAMWGVLKARYRWKQNSSEYEFVASLSKNPCALDVGARMNMRTLTLDCGSGVKLSESVTDFYLVLPATGRTTWNGSKMSYEACYDITRCLDEGFTMRIYDTDGQMVYARHTERDNGINRSMVRNMPVVDVRRQELTDLSASGTANSYMVSPDGGTYRFYALNSGNSPLLPTHGGAAKTAEVLWETRMSGTVETAQYDIVKDVVYDPDTHYISFKTTSNPGNALIALKDVADNVVWSWHIWSTDYNPDDEGGTDRYGSVELMNRNLGALRRESGDESFYGLKYQWGRKDPFDGYYKSVKDRMYKYFPSVPFTEPDEAKHTVDYMIAHPTYHIPLVWGIYDLGFSEIAALWGKEKTAYDPCPPGWQVADLDTWYQFADNLTSPNFNTTDKGDYILFNESSPAAIYPKNNSLGVWTNVQHQTWFMPIGFQTTRFEYGDISLDLLYVRCQRSTTTIDRRPVIDLSASGTANCYMVRPKHKYKFNAMVKGNTGISTGMAYNAKIEIRTENTAEQLHGTRYSWTEAYDVLLTDCYLKDGYIYFTTSLDELYGNATIVLKDPQGGILWSWHIWIVDYDPEKDYDVVDWGKAGEKKFMKMNLGALNNTTYDSRAMGMMYQWGRKDPFMGAIAYDSNTQAVYEAYSYAEYGSAEASAETSTLSYAVRHPGLAIMDSPEGDGDWLDEHENALWGEEKTIYDPCPRGWKVPTRPVYDEHSVSCRYQYGMEMDGIWYPAAGYHHSVSFNLNSVGQEGHYWYATPKDDGTAYSLYFNSREGEETLDLVNHATPKAQLNSIRCVKDE